MSDHTYEWRPIIGLVQAQETVVLEVVPAIRKGYSPAIVSNRPGRLMTKTVTASQVSVTNTSTGAVPFVLVVLPSKVLRAANLPWRALTMTLRAQLRTAEGRKNVVKALAKTVLRKVLEP